MYIYFNHCYKQVEKTQSGDNHDKTQQKRSNKKKNLHDWTVHTGQCNCHASETVHNHEG